MSPRLFRTLRSGAALAAFSAAIGCAPPAARTFAVVLEEPPTIQCYPRVRAPDIDVQQFFSYLLQTPSLWEEDYKRGRLRPAGGILHAVAGSEGLLAFFDDFQRDPYSNLNDLVFEGEPHDDYIDALSRLTHNPDADEPSDAIPDCGELTDVRSEILATIDGGAIDGRIRRTEYRHFPGGNSACAAFIGCARTIKLRGAEED